MLKGKEVISDPQRQYEIARDVHHKSHGGINKTTASIAENYHWVRIKETVSQVIRNCPECSEMNKGLSALRAQQSRYMLQQQHPGSHPSTPTPAQQPYPSPLQQQEQHPRALDRADSPSNQLQIEAAQHQPQFPTFPAQHNSYDMPVDPALMDDVHQTMNLEDLPPSPFLSAGNNLPMQGIPNLDLPASDLPNPVPRMSGDSQMSGTEERAPTAREELRRRLTRAGYASQK